MDFHRLPSLRTISQHIRVVKHDQIEVLSIQHPKATAAISLFGGHVMSFQANNQAPLLWMSEKAIFDAKTPLRGGIPICWPWFGRIASPSHGVARTQIWTFVDHQTNDDKLSIQLKLTQNEQTLAIWPYKFELLLNIEISDELAVSLHINNTDEKPWRFSGALHSYFQVQDIQQTAITGMGESYLDSLQDEQKINAPEPLTFHSGVDRVYLEPTESIAINQQNASNILVQNSGNNAAVIWNPWELSSQMLDMDDNGYKTMVCVESAWHANNIEAGKLLQPNQTHHLTTVIRYL